MDRGRIAQEVLTFPACMILFLRGGSRYARPLLKIRWVLGEAKCELSANVPDFAFRPLTALGSQPQS